MFQSVTGVARRPSAWRRRFRVLLVGLALAVVGTVPGLATPQPAAAIINGTNAPSGTYPFMVALTSRYGAGTDYDRQFCGGTLIRTRWVLTAAHCVEGETASRIRLIIGRSLLDATGGEEMIASRIIKHPGWNPRTMHNDVALIQLPRASTMMRVGLATTAQTDLWKAGDTGRVVGWGHTQSGVPTSKSRVLMHTDVPFFADTQCPTHMYPIRGSLQVCAGGITTDTCQGDSGGPLFIWTSVGWRQVGVTSWGDECAIGHAGVYAQVGFGPLRDWIISKVGAQDNTRPATTGPAHKIATDYLLGQAGEIPTRISWSATDASGIARYELWLATNGGAYAKVKLPKLASTSIVLNLKPGSVYRFGVRAYDKAGNLGLFKEGRAFTAGLYGDDTSYVEYSANQWERSGWTAAQGGTVTVTGTKGAFACFRFNGHSVGWIGTNDPTRGQARIYIDGNVVATVDMHADRTSAQTVQYAKNVDPSREHRVCVQAVGTTGRPSIDVDAFAVLY